MRALPRPAYAAAGAVTVVLLLCSAATGRTATSSTSSRAGSGWHGAIRTSRRSRRSSPGSRPRSRRTTSRLRLPGLLAVVGVVVVVAAVRAAARRRPRRPGAGRGGDRGLGRVCRDRPPALDRDLRHRRWSAVLLLAPRRADDRRRRVAAAGVGRRGRASTTSTPSCSCCSGCWSRAPRTRDCGPAAHAVALGGRRCSRSRCGCRTCSGRPPRLAGLRPVAPTSPTSTAASAAGSSWSARPRHVQPAGLLRLAGGLVRLPCAAEWRAGPAAGVAFLVRDRRSSSSPAARATTWPGLMVPLVAAGARGSPPSSGRPAGWSVGSWCSPLSALLPGRAWSRCCRSTTYADSFSTALDDDQPETIGWPTTYADGAVVVDDLPPRATRWSSPATTARPAPSSGTASARRSTAATTAGATGDRHPTAPGRWSWSASPRPADDFTGCQRAATLHNDSASTTRRRARASGSATARSARGRSVAGPRHFDA